MHILNIICFPKLSLSSSKSVLKGCNSLTIQSIMNSYWYLTFWFVFNVKIHDICNYKDRDDNMGKKW